MFKKKAEEETKNEETPVAEQKPVEEAMPSEGQKAEAEKAEESEKPSEPEKPAEPDWKTLYALTLADFDNYKKRAARDREDTYRYAEADILKDVLPAVDNLSLALANAGEDKKEDPFVKGVKLVYETLLNSLKDHGAEPFDSVGLALDTERMEAIATLPDEKIEEGRISNVAKTGWLLNEKLLRAAQVVVSAGAPAK